MSVADWSLTIRKLGAECHGVCVPATCTCHDLHQAVAEAVGGLCKGYFDLVLGATILGSLPELAPLEEVGLHDGAELALICRPALCLVLLLERGGASFLDAKTGHNHGRLTTGGKRFLDMTPTPSGRLMAVSQDGSLSCLDPVLEECSNVGQLLGCGHCKSAKFSCDGRSVFAIADGSVHIYDTATGQTVSSIHCELPVRSGAISSAGDLVLLLSDAGAAKLFETRSGKCLHDFADARQLSRPWRYASFSPDGSRFLVGSDGGRVAVYGVADREERCELSDGRNWYCDASFSPDGRRALAIRSDCAATLFEVETGEILTRFTGLGYYMFPHASTFSPDGSQVLFLTDCQDARLFDAETGECLQILQLQDAGGGAGDALLVHTRPGLARRSKFQF